MYHRHIDDGCSRLKLSWCNNSISFGISMSHAIGKWRNDLKAACIYVRIIGVDQAYRDEMFVLQNKDQQYVKVFLSKNIFAM